MLDFNPHFEVLIKFYTVQTLCSTLGGRGHWTVYYSSSQSFIIMFSYSLKPVKSTEEINTFPVWLRILLISDRLEPVLSHIEKSCIAAYYRQFFTDIKMKNHKIDNSFVDLGSRPFSQANKTGLNLIFFSF